MSHDVAATPRTSGGTMNAFAIQSMVPPQLIKALRQAAENPLGRLSRDDEQALKQLGLLRVWDDFIVLTELGRKLLGDPADKS